MIHKIVRHADAGYEEAIEIADELAEENKIDQALVGDWAMALYGSERTTKDIYIIATKFRRL